MDSSGVYLSGIFHGTFPKAVYSTMIAEKFQIYSVKITGKYICQSKKKKGICPFLLMPPTKTLSGFYQYSPGRRKLPIPTEQCFLKIYFFPCRKGGEDYGVNKITKLKRTQVLVTSFDKFHHFYIFGFCFVVP